MIRDQTINQITEAARNGKDGLGGDFIDRPDRAKIVVALRSSLVRISSARPAPRALAIRSRLGIDGTIVRCSNFNKLCVEPKLSSPTYPG